MAVAENRRSSEDKALIPAEAETQIHPKKFNGFHLDPHLRGDERDKETT